MKADGWIPYTGAWYRNDPSFDYYSGGQATFPSNIRPMAIYAASVNKTFFTFADRDFNIVVGFLDHATGKLSPLAVIGSYTLGDAHKNGSIMIDHDGYIYCFFGGHGENLRVRRSTVPFSIETWQSSVVIAGGAALTYPQPWELTEGRIVVPMRQDSIGQRLLVSTDQGATWSPTTLLANSGGFGAYFITVAEQGSFPRKIHIIWNVYESATMRRDFFYARSDDGGVSWKKSDGSTLSLPIALEAGEQILDSGTEQVNTCDLQLDTTGLVRALVLQGVGNSFVWKLIRQNGAGSWSVFTLPPPADHHFDIGSLALVGDDDWRAYLPSGANISNQDGGEIEEWQSLDRGATWVKLRIVTSGSTYVHNNVKTVVNGRSDFRIFWSYGDPDVSGTGIPLTNDVKLYMAGDDSVTQMAVKT